MLLDALQLLRYTMGNPLSRAILKLGLAKDSEGKTRLESSLEAFSYGTPVKGLGRKLYSAMVKGILVVGCKAFGANPDSFKKYLQDPVVRRGVNSVLRGISEYGIGKPQLLAAPFLVVWNFTNACNLMCKHCYQSAGVKAPDELTLEEKLDVVRQLSDAGVVAIAFSGGEPLVSPDFFKVAKEASDLGLYLAVATNGTLLSKEMVKRLKDVNVGYMEVSLDSARPGVHDEFRGVKGAWKRTVEGIRNLAGSGIYTVVATTITRMNVGEVEDIIALTEKLGAQRFTHFNFIPTGRGKNLVELDLSPQEREKLLKTLYEKAMSSKVEVLSTAPQYARVALQASGGEMVAPTHFYMGKGRKWGLQVLAEFIGGCGSGRLYCAIQPNGDVTPCVFIPQLVVGNLREKRFIEIWNESKVFKDFQNRELLKGACKSCKFKYVCGGCRARSLGYFNDFSAPDVGCIYNQPDWMSLVKEVEAVASTG
ncbi:MAG: radical SAM protein [Candidatus Bathyarchaeia archaeon]